MDKREARQVLQLFRPGANDAQDPRMSEALQCAQQDAELARWFEGHCAFHIAMRTKLKEIPVPADLKDRILREEALRKGRIVKLWDTLIPLAAAAVLLLTIGAWWYFDHNTGAHNPEQNFAEGREYLAKVPQRGYAMTMMSTNLAAIHSYLVTKQQFPDYVLPKPLASLTAAGCANLEWQGHKVSMVCLKDAKKRDVYLFAMDRANLRGAPMTTTPEFEQIHRLMTASWTVGDKVYVLAGPGDEAELKAYLD
jgi:hypothetical protein